MTLAQRIKDIMSKIYRTREGEATAVDTKTQLTTLGSEQAPGPLLVPAGVNKISRVICAALSNMAAATGFSGFIRLEGPGLNDGPVVLAVVAGGMAVATGGNGTNRAEIYDINIPVTSGNEILIFAEMAGTDVGQMSAAVTLCFE
jgi:hypothetical protein